MGQMFFLFVVVFGFCSNAFAQDYSPISALDIEKVNLELLSSPTALRRCELLWLRSFEEKRIGAYLNAEQDAAAALELSLQFPRSMTCERSRIFWDLLRIKDVRNDWVGKLDIMSRNSGLGSGSALFRAGLLSHEFVAQASLGNFARLGQLREDIESLLNRLSGHDAVTLDAKGYLNARLGFYHGLNGDRSKQLQYAIISEKLSLQAIRLDNGVDSSAKKARFENYLISLNNLSQAYLLNSNQAMAVSVSRDALKKSIVYFGIYHPTTRRCILRLIDVHSRRGDFSSAEKFAILFKGLVKDTDLDAWSDDNIFVMERLGFIEIARGDWARALGFYEERGRLISSRENSIGRLDPSTEDWALTLLKSRRYSEAREMALNIKSRRLKQISVEQHWINIDDAIVELADYRMARNSGEVVSLSSVMQRVMRDLEGAQDSGLDDNYEDWVRLRSLLEIYMEVLFEENAILGNEDFDQRYSNASMAFRIAEVARRSSVQKSVKASVARAVLPDKSLAALARQEQDYGNRIEELKKLIFKLNYAPPSEQLNDAINKMQAEVAKLAVKQNELRVDIGRKFPEYIGLISPSAPNIAEVKGNLASNEALVSLYLADEKVFVWVISGRAWRFRVVDFPRKQVEAAVDEVRGGVDLSDGFLKPFKVDLANEIYAKLLAPDADLWTDSEILNIVSGGALAKIPFGFLVTDKSPDGKVKWLIQNVAVAQQPSNSTLISLRGRAKAGGSHPGVEDLPENDSRLPFIGFGDPVFEPGRDSSAVIADSDASQVRRLVSRKLNSARDDVGFFLEMASGKFSVNSMTDAAMDDSRTKSPYLFNLLSDLPDTSVELRSIAVSLNAKIEDSVYVHERANETNVKRAALWNYKVVAFATHGISPGEVDGVDEPQLALSNPRVTGEVDNDGMLTLQEVMGLTLNSDWVVLSACNTASSDGTTNEAISGLGRGFFFAGAKSLLVSNWAVETVSARMLTTKIFELQRTKLGLSKAQALRESIVDLINDPSGEYNHPAFWAPFSVVGDGL